MELTINAKTGQFTLTGQIEKTPYVTDKGSTIIASSHGNQTLVVDGKAVKVGFNAYLPKQ